MVDKEDKLFFSASEDNSIIVWSIDKKSPVFLFCNVHQCKEKVCYWDIDTVDNLILTHRGSRIISSGNRDNIIKIWDLFEKRLLFELNQDLTDHGVTSDWVSAIALTFDDKTLVSGSVDGSLCIWDLEERILKHTILRGHDGKKETFNNSKPRS